MAESLNTRCDLAVPGISYMGLNSYGKFMIGDKAFEFYNDRNVNDYIQIPWNEVEYIVADVLFKGRWIPRFAIETKNYGVYRFGASKRTKEVLRACREYVPEDRIRSARSAHRIALDNLKTIISNIRGGKK